MHSAHNLKRHNLKQEQRAHHVLHVIFFDDSRRLTSYIRIESHRTARRTVMSAQPDDSGGGLRKLRLPRVRLDLEHVRDGATPAHALGFHVERDEEGYLVCFIHNELRTLGFFMLCVAAIVTIVVLIAHGSLHMLDMDDIQVRVSVGADESSAQPITTVCTRFTFTYFSDHSYSMSQRRGAFQVRVSVWGRRVLGATHNNCLHPFHTFTYFILTPCRSIEHSFCRRFRHVLFFIT